MVMPSAGTFKYVAVVPDLGEKTSPWHLRLREPIQRTGEPLRDDRLLGYSPSLQITSGIPAPTGFDAAIRRARFSLTSFSRVNATIRSASFHVDQELTRAFRPGIRARLIG